MFTRVAIVNRGEAAMRLLHAVAELNAEGGPRIETVALYTDVDATATFVRAADVAYDLGPAADRPYLDLAVLERALVETGADAAWVGWGFVAEDPAFAELCGKLGVTFVGPAPEAMRALGDKIGAKLLAEQAGVPVAPWSRGPVRDVAAALRAAEEIGYPLMLKATAGGGGRGIRAVAGPDELVAAYERTSREAARTFGSGVVFLERLVTGARHVEVQVVGDGQGTAWALGVRDCSVQRRNQKIIEESASPVLPTEQAGELKAAAERLLLAVDYCGAATVEFLHHPGERRSTFLEVNTRLQVEHPVTEATTGIDLVKAQLSIAAGGKLTGERPVERGHAVEARLNAEDPDRDLAPAPGRITHLGLPAGPGIRVDTGVGEGDVVPAEFDSMIAKIVASGRDREEALSRLRRAVRETTVVVQGGGTNKSVVLELLDAPEVVDGSADTGWVDRMSGTGRLTPRRHDGVALVVAAIGVYRDENDAELRRLLSTAHGGRPQVQHESARTADLTLRGTAYRLTVAETGPQRYRVRIGAGDDARTVDAAIGPVDRHRGWIDLDGHRFGLVTDTHGGTLAVEIDGVTHRVGRGDGAVVRAPAPGLVIATPVAAGDEVGSGDPVLVLEAMKTESVVAAPFRARITESLVSVGSQVDSGAPLLRLEPCGPDAADVRSVAPCVLPDLPDGPTGCSAEDRVRRMLADLRGRLLGFDADPGGADGDHGAAVCLAARAELGRRAPVEAEVELLEIFADLSELGRIRPDGEPTAAGTRASSPRELFHTYLRSLDVERAALPEEFRGLLTRVLGHYGVDGLDRTRELEDAVFRIVLAQRRTESGAAVMTAVLRQWLADAPPSSEVRSRAEPALGRLIQATRLRFPTVGDLARNLAFRWYAVPPRRRARAESYARLRGHLRHLEACPDAPDRDERIAALLASPEPLVRLLGPRISRPGADVDALLEVLVRRVHEPSDVRCAPVRGRPVVCGDVAVGGELHRVVATVADVRDLAGAVAAIAERSAADAAPATVVATVYLTWDDRPADGDVASAVLHEALSAAAGSRGLHRITVTVVGRGDGSVQHVTFRRGPDGLTEDRVLRGLNPVVGQRLRLDRLRNFDLTRLPSANADVLLLRGVAPANPSDERLVAVAQIRDLTPLRDREGRILALPAVQSALDACLDAIRAEQARRPASRRLDTNRIFFYVWPPSDLAPAELEALARRLALTSAGAGVEEILFVGRRHDPGTGVLRPVAARVTWDVRTGVRLTLTDPPTDPLQPLDDYGRSVLQARRRGAVHPYELTDMLAGPGGTFTEHDLDGSGALVPVDRPKGGNEAGIVTGVATTPTDRHPEGVTRVALLSDPTKALGALSEPECVRVAAALDLAERMRVPVEWFALSAGARIAMDSGTENMDAIAAALRRIVLFTQDGGEINVVVAGVNVGAQPYWNAEATMLMHTKGILVMTPDSAMVLTGKRSLDFSGGVSAEDNLGIGGHDRIMGPSGQAQYWAPDLRAAHDVLLSHYDHCHVVPGEDGPRRARTSDPADRDVRGYPHDVAGSEFTTVGQIFCAATNPDRKKPFDIRTVMRAVADQDHAVLERWAGMADAQSAVVLDVHLGGLPVCLLGVESRSVPRAGFPPTDGPDTYTAGTLYPRSSKKVARAINAASGNRPLVVLANLSGFDGSPESMRGLQLEYGAEIGRAIVNFDGPIVFCVVSRYHGGAFVVFSKALNPDMTVLAVEGSYASVLGGAPAAAVVFADEVDARTARDARVTELDDRVASAGEGQLAVRPADVRSSVRAEKLSEVAAEFDSVHSIQRAQRVGSVDSIIRPAELRPRIIAAVERGLARTRERAGQTAFDRSGASSRAAS